MFVTKWFLLLPIALSAVDLNAQVSIFGKNLIVNGDAESGSASLTSPVTSIPGWTRTGSPNVFPYNATGSLQTATAPAPPDHGFQFFATGAGPGSLTQTIDVSSAATAIAAGNVKYTATAFIGFTYGTSPSLTVAFQNANGQAFSTVTLTSLGNTGSVQFSSYLIAVMKQQTQIGIVPPGTTKVALTLTFNGAPANYYGTADSLALQFDQLGTDPNTVLGPNLIVNPGAEGGPNAPPGQAALYIPGWSSDSVTVAPYGGASWIQTSDPGPSDRGTSLFVGDASNMYQDLDISPATSLIDAAKVTFQISAWLGGVGGTDSPTLTYTFYDWTGKTLATAAQIGPVTHNGIGLVLASASGPIPVGTRRVRVALTFPGSANIPRVADNISFSLTPAGAPTITPGGIVPVFSTSTTIQPGSWCSIYGTNLASSVAQWNGDFPTRLNNVSVTVNSKPAYLWFVSPTQINFQAPDDTAAGPVAVTVTTANGSATSTVNLGTYGPSFSLFNSKYPAAIVPLVGAAGNSGQGYDNIGPAGGLPFTSRPAKAGETLILFGVGFGPTKTPAPAGQILQGAAESVTYPAITIGGVSAKVLYAGETVEGLYQFNVVVPAAGSGDKVLQATIAGLTTQANVYLTLQ